MRRIFPGIILLCCCAAFVSESNQNYPVVSNNSFKRGEFLKYRVNFGIFTVGEATTQVDNKTYLMNGRPCYKIDAFGSTSGWVSWLSKVDDNWGAYVDTAAIVTHVSYRNIKEGHYRKEEYITYDHEHNKADVKVKNKTTGVFEAPKTYNTPAAVRDIVAGFMYLRVINFDKHKKGDTITVSGFFEDTAYKMQIIYFGKEKIHTNFGKMRCHKLVPIVPDNKLFDGKNSVTAWLSDDLNQVPIKVQAKMFIGSTGLELEQFGGLRNQLKIIGK